MVVSKVSKGFEYREVERHFAFPGLFSELNPHQNWVLEWLFRWRSSEQSSVLDDSPVTSNVPDLEAIDPQLSNGRNDIVHTGKSTDVDIGSAVANEADDTSAPSNSGLRVLSNSDNDVFSWTETLVNHVKSPAKHFDKHIEQRVAGDQHDGISAQPQSENVVEPATRSGHLLEVEDLEFQPSGDGGAASGALHHGEATHSFADTTASLNPSDFESLTDYVVAIRTLDDLPGSSIHSMDQSMGSEHSALFALVARSDASHIAVSNGSWFDPETWYQGRIPGDGSRILIPGGIEVIYDQKSEASLFTVRIDGKLSFAPHRDTFMEVDTLVVSRSGHLQIGSKVDPINSGNTAQIQIAKNGPIDVSWDPLLLSRGIVSHGQIEIHGEPKDSHLKLSIDAMAGDTTLTLAERPYGWQAGDKIVLTGTHLDPWHWYDPGARGEEFRTEDEELVIVSISGDTIVLDRPLSHDHNTPDSSLKASVANYSRNVSINSASHEAIPNAERGHVMIMHSDDVDIKYAEFLELGRTDKSIRALDAKDVMDIAADTNVKGRYALHVHKAGVGIDNPPVTIEGNAVWGSPGWGIVHHESYANLTNNATYNTFGAGYVAEAGNETGSWTDNIAIKAEGVIGLDKDAADVAAFDLGRTGAGFWFQSRLVGSEDNIAAGVNRGFVYLHRGEMKEAQADTLRYPEILRGLDKAGITKVPIHAFKNNEVFASNEGLVIVKGNPRQGHDLRSVFDGFKAWEVINGIKTGYTAHYTFKDILLIGAEDNPSYHGTGLRFGNLTFDMVANNALIKNFETGVKLTNSQHASLPNIGGNENYIFIDVAFSSVNKTHFENFSESRDIIITSDKLNNGVLNFEPGDLESRVWNFESRAVLIAGTKNDSIGSVDYGIVDNYEIDQKKMSGILSTSGYYQDYQGRKIVIIEEYISDRATGAIDKVAIPIVIAEDVPLKQGPWFLQKGDAKYNGVIDLSDPAPVANDDFISTVQNRSVSVTPITNDHHELNRDLWLDGNTVPEHGSLTPNEDGSLIYQPDAQFTGIDSFEYWVTAGNGSYSRASVFFQVDEAPMFVESSFPETINEFDIF